MKNRFVKLKVLGITFSQIQTGAYALILSEEGGVRRLPIIIGTPEAQSIAIFLENLHPPRPLTHDLFTTFVNLLEISLKEVYIHKYNEGIFCSKIIFSDGTKDITIDSRTSDAIALAIRANASIYTTEEIMKENAIVMNEHSETEDLDNDLKSPHITLKSMGENELRRALDEAVMMENYEKASYIRDLINKIK